MIKFVPHMWLLYPNAGMSSGDGAAWLCATCIFSMAEVLLPVSELSRDTECEDSYDSVSSFPHSHPSDLKHRFHRHQSSGSLHGSFNHNHVQDTSEPLVAEEHDEEHDKGPVYDPKQDVFSSLFVSFTLRLENGPAR